MNWAQRLGAAALCAAIIGAPVGVLAQNDSSTQATTGGTDDSFTLNLKGADINTLIATVSEVTGRNFVVDPRVKGKVTVLSHQPMTPAELYQTFLSVLDVHGFAAVPAGEVTKIIPQVTAKQAGGFGGPGGTTGEDIVTKVIHLNNVPADHLVPILRPLVPQYGHLAAYSAANSLVISDREANVARLTQIVHRLDANGASSVASIHLKNANASEVADAIDKLQGQGKNRKKGAGIVADKRTNSVIISGTRQERAKLRSIIASMDTKAAKTGNTQVVYLNYADAETMAPILQAYATGQSYSNGSQRSSQLSGFGNNSGFGQSQGMGSGFGNVRSSVSRRRSGASGGSAQSVSGNNHSGVSVIAEAAANALIIQAPADKMKQIKQVISQLDIRRAQVLVEAIIAEISLSRSRQLGINIGALKKGGPAAASILDSHTLSAIPSLANNGTPLSLIQKGLNIALGNYTSGAKSFALLINALSGNADTNVLSTPSLITRDNEEAEIKVGKKVPFKTGSYTNGNTTTANGSVNPFTTINRQEVGLQLGFIPQVSAGDTIQLTIDQEISSIAPSSEQSSSVDLITNNRALRTSVEVKSGQILVLGGLIDNHVTSTQQAVPVISKIPLLGALFRYSSVSKEKRNLLNFIRPTILRGNGEANYYTRKKYQYIRSLQEKQGRKKIPLMNNKQRPQLPPIQNFSGGTHASASHNEKGAHDRDHSSNKGGGSHPFSEKKNGHGRSLNKRRGDGRLSD